MSENIVKSNKLVLLMLATLLIVAVIILANYFSFTNINALLIDELENNQFIKTDYIAKQIEAHVIRIRDELVTLSRFPVMDSLDSNQCTGDMRLIHTRIEGKIDSLLRVDREGDIIECSSPLFSNYIGLNIKNKEYFIIPRDRDEPYISGIERQGLSKQIIVSAPLFETTEYTPYPNFLGEFQGVLLSIIEVSSLYDSYIYQNLESNKNLFLLVNIETNDTILKSSELSDYSELKDYLTIDEQIINLGDYGQTIVTSSNITIGPETWDFIVLTPLNLVSQEIISIQSRHLFSLGVIIAMAALIVFFVYSLYKSKEEVETKLEKTNVTLEKLGINVEVESGKFNQADIVLKSKNVYLIKEDDENHAHELFISSLNRGYAGLGIVRENPAVIKKNYNLQKTSFIWLAKSKVKNFPCETKIDNLYKLISEFIKESKKSVILIDRLDYIISENSFDEVLKMIHSLKDLVSNNETIVILSANPDLISESRLKAIEVESVDLYGKQLRERVELSDLEMNILNYINERNVTNKLVSYKDITMTFNITKPTTRVKISNLQNLGLVQVELKGRFKSIKITSAGRRILR